MTLTRPASAGCRRTWLWPALARVLITCDEPNTASRRVIEGNSGILENTLGGECRYWIDLSQNPRPAA
jgi:RimJ/RimL family protein N-acetyltransferase